ncbi:MAG TPA: adenylate kinase [Anaerolineales bacterium]|nr:adenylate kinase [Anaerolineales bacterium]
MAAGKQPKYFVLFGPPGAGKGTQAKIVSESFGLAIVATGDIFRSNLTNRTELGLLVEEYLAAGELVPDDVTIKMVRETLATPRCSAGVILDGFPRTIEQAEAFIEMVAGFGGRLQVVFIRVPEPVLVERIAGRVICRKCGKVFHKSFNPPPSPPEVCEAGGEHDLFQREDDRVDIVSNRIRVYNEQTMPLIEFFDQRGYLVVVDGTQEIEMVTAAIMQGLVEDVPSG